MKSACEDASRAETAERLHSIAIHLLRNVRRQDTFSGLTAARLSALSVLVFGGPTSIGSLAEAEQVQLPTMSRLVASLEQAGLVERRDGAHDKRVAIVQATPEGIKLLHEGRKRRTQALAEDLKTLSPEDLRVLQAAAGVLERVLEAK
jgi:DNA-binding MarR family transcriptional regulator